LFDVTLVEYIHIALAVSKPSGMLNIEMHMNTSCI